MWGVLKKSIFAYLKFDICIPVNFQALHHPQASRLSPCSPSHFPVSSISTISSNLKRSIFCEATTQNSITGKMTFISVKVNISKFQHLSISESKVCSCLTVYIIRSEELHHQAFLEKMMDSGKGQINTRVKSRILTEIFNKNPCLIVPSCNT